VASYPRTTFGLRRAIGAGLIALLVLAQSAAAADRCLMERLSGHHESPAVATGDHYDGTQDAHCVSDPGPEAQAPATEPKRATPDLDPGVTRVVRWDVAPRADVRSAQFEPSHTGPPRTLQYRRLRL
jgi:hypothetical protein